MTRKEKNKTEIKINDRSKVGNGKKIKERL